jgi:hypothetical protein
MASGSTAIAAAAPRTPRPRWSDRVVLFRAGRWRLGRPPVRVRRPVRPHVGADEPARCADHPRAQGSHERLVRQPVGIHSCAVVAPARATVDEKITAALPANVTERDGLESLAMRCGMMRYASMAIRARHVARASTYMPPRRNATKRRRCVASRLLFRATLSVENYSPFVPLGILMADGARE